MIAGGEIVAWKSLWQTVIASLAAGVGITLIFSTAILSLARLSAARQQGQPVAAFAWAVLVALGLIGTLGGIALGLIAVTHKQ